MSLPRERLFNVLNDTFDLSQDEYLKILPGLEEAFKESEDTSTTPIGGYEQSVLDNDKLLAALMRGRSQAENGEGALFTGRETVNILRSEYMRLKSDSAIFHRLEAAGVDSWDGYEYALTDDN